MGQGAHQARKRDPQRGRCRRRHLPRCRHYEHRARRALPPVPACWRSSSGLAPARSTGSACASSAMIPAPACARSSRAKPMTPKSHRNWRASTKRVRTGLGRKRSFSSSPVIRRYALRSSPRNSAGKLSFSRSGCASSRSSGRPKASKSAIEYRRAALPISRQRRRAKVIRRRRPWPLRRRNRLPFSRCLRRAACAHSPRS